MKIEPEKNWPESLMAYLDGELSDEEARQVERLLEQHPEWAEEAREMAALVDASGRQRLRQPPPEIWDRYWEEIEDRIGKHIGWWLMAIGGFLLAAYGSVKILLLAENSFVRIGLGLLILGFAILFLSVLRGHLLERPKDRYRNIRR